MKKLIALPIITGLIVFISCQTAAGCSAKSNITDIAVEQLGIHETGRISNPSV